jgi:iron(II)-dependent oxidoreductase
VEALEPGVAATLSAWVRDARERTLALVTDLTDEERMGPRLPTVNPLLWEVGHVGWFQERWVLRHAAGRAPLREDADALWDSTAIPHAVRWDLPLPPLPETLRYADAVLARVIERLEGGAPSARDESFVRLAVLHEDMHAEAFAMTRQTLGYRAPPVRRGEAATAAVAAEPVRGDVSFPDATVRLGAERGTGFVFDNEQWAHDVFVPAFAMARAPVTEGEFLAFVEEGGYARDDLWSPEGLAWRRAERVTAPFGWSREGGRFARRWFHATVPLSERRPMVHVSWHEAQAFCRFAKRRLPTEAEWERAATGGGARRFPWGDDEPTATRAHLDATSLLPAPVDAFPEGDAPGGLRQLIGNVWEWTADAFVPWPGFAPGPYREYSEPWFGTHKTLRGGCFLTRARLLRSTFRNFYLPGRRDVFAGFRTCALPDLAPAGRARPAGP